MIISRTPYRISFFGGGTDYPQWYEKHGGTVLATTIDKYCFITCRFLPPFFEHKYRVVWSKIENCLHIEEIEHPSVRETLKYLDIARGVEIHHVGDLPARSGMGSSSSFTVGLLHALYGLKGIMPTKMQLTRESIHVEQELLKETVGCQDQALAAHGGFNHITFHQNGEMGIRPIILPQDRMRELNDHLMLFYTGIKRTSSNIASSYVDDMEKKRRQLRIMKDLVDESISVLTSNQNISLFGELMQEAWLAKRSLGSAISNHEVDGIYETALEAGAIGGKITGAGGGGFMLLFVPPGRQATVRNALSNLIYVPFKFEFTGSQIIYSNEEEDYSRLEEEKMTQQIIPFREVTALREARKRKLSAQQPKCSNSILQEAKE